MGSNGNGKSSNTGMDWKSSPRWAGITRPYTAQDVDRLRGSIHIEHTLARQGAERLWDLLHRDSYVPALGAMTGNQAVQQVKAGLKAIYVSGWQVAADANDAGQMYPDQSLYPADSVPNLCRRINQALTRADQIHHAEGENGVHWFAPLIADAEAGFGGNLNAFELMKAMIQAGAACVHFEDQLSSAKKCGHLGGKVLVPTVEAIQKLVAARDDLIQIKVKANEDSLAYPQRVDAKLASLAIAVIGGNDSAPTEASYQAFAKLKKQTDDYLAHWLELQRTDLAAFQKMTAGQNIQAIVVPAAETTTSGGEEPR